MAKDKEPHNPFYILLLLSSLLFVITALAYAFVPILEDKAAKAGQIPPPSPFRDALRNDGWKWLLYELGLMTFFGFASMGLDRFRRLKKEKSMAKMPESQESKSPLSDLSE